VCLTVYFVTRPELCDVFADSVNDTGNVRAESLVLGLEKSGPHHSHQKNICSQQVPVIGIDRCSMNFDEDFVRLRDWFLDVRETNDIRRTVFGVDDCFRTYSFNIALLSKCVEPQIAPVPAIAEYRSWFENTTGWNGCE
jgi:hypothetical protein